MRSEKIKNIAGKITVGAFTAAACFFLLADLPAVITNVNADSGVDINQDTFPDEALREYVSKYCDKDHDDHLSEAEINATTKISVCDKNVKQLDGIEFFPALKELYCYDNQLTELNVSKNTALTDLYCYKNQLTSLDLSNDSSLETLYCSSNQLTSLDVSDNTALKYLGCSGN